MERIRVASLQYKIAPVRSFEDFASLVRARLEIASDYGCSLVIFPEYFTVQLLSLGDPARAIRDQVRDLAAYQARFLEISSNESKRLGLYVVAGTIPVAGKGRDEILNAAYVFAPNGKYDVQYKLHMTRFEKEEWFVSGGHSQKVFETNFGKMAINICYDVEFPELARAAAHAGATLLVTPSCTDDRKGWLRVRYCAQARAVENQMYVIHSSTVGGLPDRSSVALHYGQSGILCPSDWGFSRDGVIAEGVVNEEAVVLADLDMKLLEKSRDSGTVLTLKDSYLTKELAAKVETISL